MMRGSGFRSGKKTLLPRVMLLQSLPQSHLRRERHNAIAIIHLFLERIDDLVAHGLVPLALLPRARPVGIASAYLLVLMRSVALRIPAEWFWHTESWCPISSAPASGCQTPNRLDQAYIGHRGRTRTLHQAPSRLPALPILEGMEGAKRRWSPRSPARLGGLWEHGS